MIARIPDPQWRVTARRSRVIASPRAMDDALDLLAQWLVKRARRSSQMEGKQSLMSARN